VGWWEEDSFAGSGAMSSFDDAFPESAWQFSPPDGAGAQSAGLTGRGDEPVFDSFAPVLLPEEDDFLRPAGMLRPEAEVCGKRPPEPQIAAKSPQTDDAVVWAAPSSAAKPLQMADVEFSALFPKRFIKGEYSILEMYMYEEDQRRILDEALAAAEGALRESRGSALQIGSGSEVSIRLECADKAVQIEGSDEAQTWRGKYLKFDFAVYLEESYPKRQLMFTATVRIDGVPATRLRFTAECNTLREQRIQLVREDVVSAFVSYASGDRSRVAAIIQGMKKARPDMDVFFDVDSLRSGEDWQRALRAEIERRDVLFLCWSLAAKRSEWVNREWRYALENKGLDFIEPIPIDPPDLCPPPEELSSKCFSDRGLLYINR
jgi:hypothetical protein